MLRGVAHRSPIVAIEQMRGKAGGALQFASCLNAPSLPARNDRIVTVSNLLFAVRGNGNTPEGEKEGALGSVRFAWLSKNAFRS